MEYEKEHRRSDSCACNYRGTVRRVVFCWVRAKAISGKRNPHPRVEAGSNTSTAALRVVGSDEKGAQCLGI
jgi:hypothetical protein